MPNPTADKNLLFGILALQMDFINRDMLIAAMNTWVLEKSRSLGEILEAKECLTTQRHLLLDALLAEHLKQHDDDVEMSLAAVRPTGAVCQQLKQLDDSDVEASLVHIPSRSHESPSIGLATSLGERFTMLRELAKGGLGQISVALDKELNREVALKELQDRHADNPDSRARFVLEAEITGGLEHPGVVPVYGLGKRGDGRPYYAMRFIRGESLREAIDRYHAKDDAASHSESAASDKSLELRKLLNRFLDVCHTVQYAHSRGVLHRDLKPDNIMLGPYGETLVVDWGLAKAGGRDEAHVDTDEVAIQPSSGSGSAPTQIGSAIGTPSYMGPEQASGRVDQMGPASDVYSMGATLYCALTGRPPLMDDDVGAILKKAQSGDFPRPREVTPDVPAPLEAICLKAMARKPAERYTTVTELAEDVEHWLADEPVSAFPEPVSQRIGRWTRRHRGWTQAAAAALMLIALVSATATLLIERARQEQSRQRGVAQKSLERTAAERERAGRLRDEAMEAVRQEAELRNIAEQQEEESRKNFALARDAVDKLFNQVSQDKQLQIPELESLRLSLTDTARNFYEELVTREPTDHRLQSERGEAYARLANINLDAGRLDDVEDFFKAALEIQQRLVKLPDAVTDYRNNLGITFNSLGRYYTVIGESKEAEAAFESARRVWQPLAADFPDEHVYQNNLAIVRHNLALLFIDTNRRGEAFETEMAALASYQRLAEKYPDSPHYQGMVASSHSSLGVYYEVAGQLAKAEAAYKQAIETRSRLSGKLQDDTHQRELADTYLNLSKVYSATGRYDETERLIRDAHEIYKRLVAQHPQVLEFQSRLAGSHNHLAILLSKTERLKESEAQHLVAVDLRRRLATAHRDIPEYQLDLATSHYNLATAYTDMGRHDDAAVESQKSIDICKRLSEEFPQAPLYRERSAEGLALLARIHGVVDHVEQAEAEHLAAIGIRERLVVEFPDHPDYQEDLAANCRQLARMCQSSGRSDKAIEYLTQAMVVRRDLLGKFPSCYTSLDNLGEGMLVLAKLQSDAGKREEGIAAFQTALTRFEQLAKENPDKPDYLHAIACVQHALGQFYKHLKQQDFASKHFRAAVEIESELAQQYSDQSEYQQTLAIRHHNMAWFYDQNGEFDDAEPHYRQAIAVAGRLVDGETQPIHFTWILSQSYYNLTLLYAKMNRPADRLAAGQASLDIRERLVEIQPSNASYQNDLANSYYKQGSAYSDQAHYEKAEPHVQRAQEIWSHLLAVQPDSLDYQLNLGFTHYDLGTLRETTGRYKEAAESFQAAIGVRSQLVKARPENLDYQIKLGWGFHRLGVVLARTGPMVDAVAAYQAAIEIRKRILTSNPGSSAYISDLAATRDKLFSLYLDNSQFEDALPVGVAALELCKRLVEAHPELGWTQNMLAVTWRKMGDTFHGLGRTEEAEFAYNSAVTTGRNTVEKFTGQLSYQDELCWSYVRQGLLLLEKEEFDEAKATFTSAAELCAALIEHESKLFRRARRGYAITCVGRAVAKQGMPKDALTWHTQAAAILEKVVAELPDYQFARERLAGAYVSRAVILGQLERHGEAAADWIRKAELDEGGKNRSLTLEVAAAAFAKDGNYRQAINLAEQFTGASVTLGGTLMRTAGTYALASAAVSQDESLGANERGRLSEQYAGQAVMLLERARLGGHFKKQGVLKQLDSADLASIRGREDFQLLRALIANPGPLPRVKLTTTKGDIVLEMYEDEAPNTVANFIDLIEKDFYTGTPFHRVIEGFMAQAGCPKGDGTGGPGYRIRSESDRHDHHKHDRGVISMARASDPDSGGSQFFITFVKTPSLDGKYTVFGRVAEGMDVVDSLTRTGTGATPDKVIKATVLSKRDHPYEPLVISQSKPEPEYAIKVSENLKLADYRGQYVLLNFWASWASHAIKELPHLQSAANRYRGDPRLAVIGVSIDRDIAAARKFCNERPLDWTPCWIGDGSEWSSFGITSVPATFLVGPDGEVIAKGLRGEKIIEAMEKALGIPTPE